ncbi:protocadherin-like wing polarity protein stan [Toxorhynchites rutilus septentrionalis]|uniref:protocadherin-like wing polarity protein stan n=1 Tax=Toxorhynchites rutilus septentrionalis TaxID=329112 RepID=UPI00247AAD8F|nr:protocadherin-like wing polarity protein stan [Toxorhynchites rutilus septentrionalis]
MKQKTSPQSNVLREIRGEKIHTRDMSERSKETHRRRMLNPQLVFATAATLLVLVQPVACQIINRTPHFIPGTGDMSRFSLSENTPVGSVVYQLRGVDPEGSKLRYSISGPVFSVDRETGVVRLRQSLDRELQDSVEVIISLTDEGIAGTDPNTVSLRREIPIRDYNDNAPTFIGRPYSASMSESTKPGSVVKISPEIIVTDLDEGLNADVKLSCYLDPTKENDDICEVFEVKTEKIAEGKFGATIVLKKTLDFETRPSYILSIQAKDGASTNPLKSYATVAITILDVQDQPPVFINAPYSASIPENTPEGTTVLTINATDGDTGSPRPIVLSLENEYMGHFKLKYIGNPRGGVAELITSDRLLDREDPTIVRNGGAYTFSIRATELINNELPGDSTSSQITIVLRDVDDHIPVFNKPSFEVSIPENLEQDTPLPDLTIIVTDMDLGVNSRYSLSLRNIRNAEGVFTVAPTNGEGRTPVVVKVRDPSKLDYDVSDASLRTFVFDIVASVDGEEKSKTQVTVNLQDSNDNSPVFPHTNYKLNVKENSPKGFKIANITAIDHDTGMFGKLSYAMKGFGADYFYTDPKKGGVFVNLNLDYEEQKSYSLALVATDGGGRETNANLLINVMDVNDNYPAFESLEYTRTIREGATDFEPQFFVHATDADGPQQGGGKVTYTIESENSISGHVFTVDPNSGEIKITRPVNSMDTERGQYELIVVATDHGVPPLKNDTRVLVRVGISGNQRPIFKGLFHKGKNDIPGPPSYRVSIPENAPAGYSVTNVSATDPDGMDDLLRYKIVGASDNFEINDYSGQITVARDARLDRDTNPDSYTIVVNAIDAGFPIPETATTTVYVKIQDVNDKPPKFSQQGYTAYISERSVPNTEVLRVSATDTDVNAKILYSIIEPMSAKTKAGIPLQQSAVQSYKTAFRIGEDTGVIYVNSALDYNQAAVITLTIRAVDVNAEYNIDMQEDRAEVTLFIQSFKDVNPVFKNKGWSTVRPKVEVKIKEEAPIGSAVMKIEATDPVMDVPITTFELLMPDVDGYFSLNEQTGDVILNKRLDYETINKMNIDFVVRALAKDKIRQSLAYVNVTVENVNDNAPVFEKEVYRTTVMESDRYPHKIITVKAKDDDALLTDKDKQLGYNSVRYSLEGSHANLFTIDNKTGEISIAKGQVLDREKQSVLKIVVIAKDSPGKTTDARRGYAEVVVDVLDVNDNAPIFGQKSYTAVIPENVLADTFVIVITAQDPDEGPGGEVRYDFLNEGEANGLLQINPKSGEIKTKVLLTGKGRSDPYEIIVRAQDNGSQLPKQRSLYNDTVFTLYIGDISANDGIPFFIAPKVGQIANVTENATLGAPVFQVVASDPDSPTTPSGTLQYRIQSDIEDAKSFRIDSKTGLITTTKSLDREVKSMYNIIIEVSDMGNPPQAATIVLRINVLDIDDHQPRFARDVDSQPIEMWVLEEQPAGAIVGNLTAIDEDIGENGAIDYEFTDGNELGLFRITRTENSAAVIITTKPLDRETLQSVSLTIKCFQHKPDPSPSAASYNKYDKSEQRIIIHVMDIDDHPPLFEKYNQTVGIRHNVPIDTPIVTCKARDEDSNASPIFYSLESVTFVPQFYRQDNQTEDYMNVFNLNNATGEIRTTGSMSNYVDGFFQIAIKANNSPTMERAAENHLKIFVTRDKSLLRFVFAKPPSEVNTVLEDFAADLQSKLTDYNLELSVFDAQVLAKPDHSLDFSSTSSCFQLTRHGSALSPLEMLKIMDSQEMKDTLLDTYMKYSVHKIDSCSIARKQPAAALIASSGTWLVVLAALIGFAAFASTMAACCLARRYKMQIQSTVPAHRISGSDIYGSATPVLYTEPIYGAL